MLDNININRHSLTGIFILITGIASGCSSHIPREISTELPVDLSITQVRSDIDSSTGKQVRWGGIILNIENHQDTTWLTIMSKPLWDSGRPDDSDTSQGRYIAVISNFLDPEVYRANRKITVIGNILKSETRKVGEFPYQYPVVQVEHHYLWVKETPASTNTYPYRYYDPWYDPWYDPFYNHNHLHPYPYLH